MQTFTFDITLHLRGDVSFPQYYHMCIINISQYRDYCQHQHITTQQQQYTNQLVVVYIYIYLISCCLCWVFEKHKRKKYIKVDICTLWDAKQWQIKANFHQTQGLKNIFRPWAVGVTAVPSLSASRDQTDVHHIANAFICVLSQSAPVETEGEYADNNNVHRVRPRGDGSTFGHLTSSSADISASCLFASPSTGWRRRHSTSTGRAELIRLLCSLPQRLVRSGPQINLLGVKGGELVHSEWVHTHPEGSDNMDASMTLFPIAHFSAT